MARAGPAWDGERRDSGMQLSCLSAFLSIMDETMVNSSPLPTARIRREEEMWKMSLFSSWLQGLSPHMQCQDDVGLSFTQSTAGRFINFNLKVLWMLLFAWKLRFSKVLELYLLSVLPLFTAPRHRKRSNSNFQAVLCDDGYREDFYWKEWPHLLSPVLNSSFLLFEKTIIL